MLFILQIIIEKTLALNDRTTYLIFIDYTKAFDRVEHSLLFRTMLDMGIPRHLVGLVQGLYKDQAAAVRWDGELTDWFKIGQETRQGCNISPTEFNLYAEDIMRRTEENNLSTGVVVGGIKISNLRYAEDTTIVGDTEDSAKKYFADLVEESAHSNMKVNN